MVPQYLAGQVSGEASDAVDDVLASTEAMNQMVSNLLDISRGENGALVPRLTTVRLLELLKSIEQRLMRRMAKRQQTLEITADAQLRVHVDESLLVRTIENLVDNALRYSPRGAVVSIDASSSDDALELDVTDEGAGIPSGERERVFEKDAYAEKGALKRSSRGLGLVFCRLAVQSVGGEITVMENRPRGTIFRIRLPGATEVR